MRLILVGGVLAGAMACKSSGAVAFDFKTEEEKPKKAKLGPTRRVQVAELHQRSLADAGSIGAVRCKNSIVQRNYARLRFERNDREIFACVQRSLLDPHSFEVIKFSGVSDSKLTTLHR